MSYILDALRKSDQQRRRGAAPTLLPAQAEPVAPKRPALFAYAALAIVLLGAGIGIGWLHPWQPGPAAPAPAVVAVKPSAPVQEPAPLPQPAIAPSPQPELPAQISPAAPGLTASAAPAAAIPPAPAPQEQAEEVKRARRGTAPKPAAEAGKSSSPAATSAAAGGASAQGSPVVAMGDLPVAIQQELPPMSISVHAYSGIAAQRLVGINNRLLHEGDEVVPGLKLEQITPNGMILSYKGYSFRHGVH